MMCFTVFEWFLVAVIVVFIGAALFFFFYAIFK